MSSMIVSGMSCNHCTAAVAKAMEAVPGAGEVRVDLASGKAEWNGPAGIADMIKAVEAQGYEVKKG